MSGSNRFVWRERKEKLSHFSLLFLSLSDTLPKHSKKVQLSFSFPLSHWVTFISNLIFTNIMSIWFVRLLLFVTICLSIAHAYPSTMSKQKWVMHCWRATRAMLSSPIFSSCKNTPPIVLITFSRTRPIESRRVRRSCLTPLQHCDIF